MIRQNQVTIILGDYVFEMKCFKIIKGHDDSLPFQGKLYVNGRHIADCVNNGWGGACDLQKVDKNRELFDKMYAYVRQFVEFTFKDTTINYTLSSLADSLACKMADAQWLNKHQKTNLIFKKKGCDDIFISFKNPNGKKVDITQSQLYVVNRRKIFDTIAKYEEQGYRCINTNIWNIDVPNEMSI